MFLEAEAIATDAFSKSLLSRTISLLARHPVILIGGLTSIPGAIVGGLIIGAGEKLGEIYLAEPLGGQGIENWFAYTVALVFLMLRPTGIFGEKQIERI